MKKIVEEKTKTLKSLEKELADFVARNQDLEDQNEKLKEDKNKLQAKTQDLEAENEEKDKKIAELLDKIKELEKNITKPECINNTGCPSKQACVRYSCMIIYSGSA